MGHLNYAGWYRVILGDLSQLTQSNVVVPPEDEQCIQLLSLTALFDTWKIKQKIYAVKNKGIAVD